MSTRAISDDDFFLFTLFSQIQYSRFQLSTLAAMRLSRETLRVARQLSQHRSSSCSQPGSFRFEARRNAATYTARHHADAISILPTAVDTSSSEYQENASQMREVISKLETLTKKIHQGGPPKAREKHLARKKMLPRDRVQALIDPGTSFLELSALAGEGLYGEDVPAGGIITGVGVVEGVTCMIVANDSTVKGGTYYPITVKKHVRAQAIAEENKLP
jgi:3-methylcrotonyl-CoA carboxylase beta subunit